jgi:hypothetical protein
MSTLGSRMTIRRWQGFARRWRRDTRGTSLVTTALTLPLLIALLMGIYYLYMIMAQKQALNNGVQDAAHYISENARYWNLDPSGQSGVAGDLLPEDYYDTQARRMVESRVRDVIFYPPQLLSDTLKVWVEPPALAYVPGKSPPVIEDGSDKVLCETALIDQGQYRDQQNIRFRVMAQFKVPLWQVRIPYLTPWIDITLTDRSIGYVQCPRWKGKRQAEDYDKSKWLGSEGPFMEFRFYSTPMPIPTVTGTIPIPTNTPIPTPVHP